MTTAAIINLVIEVGWPLAAQLIDAHYSGKAETEVTLEQWGELKALSEYRSADALKAAGGPPIKA